MALQLFTEEDFELIHMQIIDASGGSHGTRDRGRLSAVVAAQTQAVFDKEPYPDVHDKAAAIARGIIADHPFVDGNKRTGMLSAVILLERNGVKTNIPDQEFEDFAVRIATDRLDIPEVAAWLRAHTH